MLIGERAEDRLQVVELAQPTGPVVAQTISLLALRAGPAGPAPRKLVAQSVSLTEK